MAVVSTTWNRCLHVTIDRHFFVLWSTTSIYTSRLMYNSIYSCNKYSNFSPWKQI